jgi:arsenical pump membrane protein
LLTFLCLRWFSRAHLRGELQTEAERISLSTEGKLALVGLALAAAALVSSSALGLSLGAPTCAAAVLAMGVVAWRDRSIPLKVAKGVSWSVLPLVAGLFIIVEALQNAGLLSLGLTGLQVLAETPAWAARGLTALAVALLSNGMNNLPVGLMAGAAIRHAQQSGVVAHAILIGVDLGPNLSVTGSLATILWLIALRREKVEITAWEFFTIGVIAMPLPLIGSLLVLRN